MNTYADLSSFTVKYMLAECGAILLIMPVVKLDKNNGSHTFRLVGGMMSHHAGPVAIRICNSQRTQRPVCCPFVHKCCKSIHSFFGSSLTLSSLCKFSKFINLLKNITFSLYTF